MGLAFERFGAGIGAFDSGAAQFFESKVLRQLLHDREPEIDFIIAGKKEAAIGFVNANELRAFLELFFGVHNLEFEVLFGDSETADYFAWLKAALTAASVTVASACVESLR